MDKDQLKEFDKYAKYLKEQGVSIEDLTVSSQGEATPVQSNETESGRHNNRRVDIHS